MTIRLPKPGLLDKILAWLGKERRILPPPNTLEIHERFRPYVTIRVEKENFWTALFRRKN